MRVALVTGAGTGIGRATALALAVRGAKVVLASRTDSTGEAAAEAVRDAGGEAMFVRTDVARPEEVARLVSRTVETFGPLDVAVNNAGVEGRIAPLHELEPAQWDDAMGVNLRGVFLCMKHEIRAMLEHGDGAIVNVASIYALRAAAGSAAYVAAKHALIGLTKAAALDYAAAGIRINAICPGAIRTAMLERVAEHFGAGVESFAEQIPMKRLGTPEEMADAIAWLCSNEAAYVTGAVLVADGGLVAG